MRDYELRMSPKSFFERLAKMEQKEKEIEEGENEAPKQ